MPKHPTELQSKNTALTKKVENFKQWTLLLSRWGVKHNVTEAIEILNKLSVESNSLLKNNKAQYAKGILDTASDISDEVEKHHINKHQSKLFTSAQTLLCEAEKITPNNTSLKDIQNALEKKDKPKNLLQSIDFYNTAINSINQFIKNRQTSLKKNSTTSNNQAIPQKFKDTLKNPQNHRIFCKPVKITSIQHVINNATQKNSNNLMIAAFGDKQFIEKFFTKLYGKPMLLNEEDNNEQETAILWRVTLSKNTIIYILGLTTDKLLKHSGEKWFKLLASFNSVLISLENFEQLSDKNSTALMVILSMIHHDAIHLVGPTSDQSEEHSYQHFLFQHITHTHFENFERFQNISNWIIRSIFPYKG